MYNFFNNTANNVKKKKKQLSEKHATGQHMETINSEHYSNEDGPTGKDRFFGDVYLYYKEYIWIFTGSKHSTLCRADHEVFYLNMPYGISTSRAK